MVNTAADRRARVEQLRARQVREERKGRAIVIGAVTVVLAVVLAAVVWAVSQSPRAGSQASAGAGPIAGLRTCRGYCGRAPAAMTRRSHRRPQLPLSRPYAHADVVTFPTGPRSDHECV
jgi:hypothetical protein